MPATVRFSAVVQASGQPEVYLPLADPKHDRNFMRAVREQRVLSLKQEPTGTKKDFGTVGFLAEKYVSYLIFPKPLTAFADKRIVGIKYDTVQDADITAPKAAARPLKRSVKPATPKPKPRPRPKRFTATVRITSTNEVKVTVKALDEDEARKKAEQEAHKKVRDPDSRIETELLSLKAD
jgi:hypothetical protein